MQECKTVQANVREKRLKCIQPLNKSLSKTRSVQRKTIMLPGAAELRMGVNGVLKRDSGKRIFSLLICGARGRR